MGVNGSKRKSNAVTAHDKAILKVKLLRDTVKIYLKNVEQSLQYEQDLAIQLIQRGRRERAKCILRKQLVLLDHLKVTDRQLESLEETIHSLESTALQAKIFEGLRAGNLALKRAHEVLNIKNVELILEETFQAIEKQEEINKMVSILGIAKSEESFTRDLDQELDSLAEKNQPSVVISKENSSKESAVVAKKPSYERLLRKTRLKSAKYEKSVVPQPSTSTATKVKSKKSSKKSLTKEANTLSTAKGKNVGISINDN